MRRKGSAFTGLGALFLKELADHLTGLRMMLLQLLIALAAIASVYAAGEGLRATTVEDRFAFLRLFTTASDMLPAFVTFLGLLVPLMAIALGFDAVNGEHARRTMSRLLAQPIYRDAVLLGKLLAGLAALALVLTALWLLVIGLGILTLGQPPSGAEVARIFAFLLATIGYAAIWLAVALFCSVLIRQPATAALAALAIWLVVSLFWPLVAGLAANTFASGLAAVDLELWLARISPAKLYTDVTLVLLNPETRTVGPVFLFQLYGAVLGAPLRFWQSVLLVWPHLTGLVAATILLFTGAYLAFQRQEIRA